MIFYLMGVVTVLVLLYLARHVMGGIFGLYKIVPVNEAHVRILKNKKETFSSRTGKSSYWIVPFMTKVERLPLTNLAIPINDIKLNDKNMAKFNCDIMCFVNIDNIDLAIERLPLTDSAKDIGFDFVKLSDDFHAIMESIGRTVTTKQTILDIYMDRQTLDKAITEEVKQVFPKWGISLVDLELKEIKDAPGSTIIADIERQQAAVIRRDADIKVAQMNKDAAVATAENQEISQKAVITQQQNVAIAQQEANLAVQLKKQDANVQQIEAQRKLDVGSAEIGKQIIEQQAQAARIQVEQAAEAQNAQIMKVGQAEADIIRIKKEADAAGTLKLAQALKEYNDVAINVKILDINKEVSIAKFNAMAAMGAKADIKWIMSGDQAQSFFGLDLTAQGGANLAQFLGTLGVDADKIKSIVEMVKK